MRGPVLTDERKAMIAGVAIPVTTAILTAAVVCWVLVALVWGSVEMIRAIGGR